VRAAGDDAADSDPCAGRKGCGDWGGESAELFGEGEGERGEGERGGRRGMRMIRMLEG